MANREQKRKMNKKSGTKKVVKIEKEKKGYLEKKLGNDEMASFVKTIVVVVVSFLVVFGLTILLSNLGVFDKGYTRPDTSSTVISYEEILIGNVFNRVETEYYVVLDDFSDNMNNVYLKQKISEYKTLPIYKVDMSKGINKNYLSDSSNYRANNVLDLKIKLPTLIKIVNGSNKGYFEGVENIVNELFK